MNEYEALREVIARATRYDRTYMAKVLIDLDPEGKGRVQIAIPDLGILTPAEGVWADVEMPIGVNVSPKAGDWVAVYFLGGDPSKPCVRGRTSIIKDNLPKNANCKQVFYEDDNTKIYYDEINSELSIDTKYKMTVNSFYICLKDLCLTRFLEQVLFVMEEMRQEKFFAPADGIMY